MLRLLAKWDTAEQKRIAALKAFCSFLVKKGLLDPARDPSRTLTVPASHPEKAIREKGYTMTTIEALYRALNDQGSRDVLLLHAKLGLHESEVQRIAAGGGRIALVPGHPVISGTVKFVHKSGRVHTLSLDAHALVLTRTSADGRADRLVDGHPSGASEPSAGVMPIKPGSGTPPWPMMASRGRMATRRAARAQSRRGRARCRRAFA